MLNRGITSQWKQLLGVGIAVGLLAAIFIPYQTASAFTVDVEFPNNTDNSITQSASGEEFEITITVEAGELISIDSVTLIRDNGLSSVGIAKFDSSGNLISGSNGIVKDDEITISNFGSSSNYGYGYGYGYGYASTGYSFSSPYSYNIVGNNQFLGGNNLGYSTSSGGTSFVNGLVGPGTITISGTLATASLSAGTHTLNVLIDTGANGNNADQLTAPVFTFTVTANSNIVTTTVNTSTNASPVPINIGGGTVTIDFGSITTGGNIYVETVSFDFLDSIYSSIFTSIFDDIALLNVGSSEAITVGEIIDIDISELATTGTFDVTIPYNPSLVPGSESDVKFLHWTGTAWEDKTLSVDTEANTVTGRLSTLSPVTAGALTGVSSSSSSGSSSGGGGGGGRGGGGGTVVVGPSPNQDFTTYPDSYFVLNPLSKIVVMALNFINAQGAGTQQVDAGEPVSISATFKNYQERTQSYAFIVQVTNSDGETVVLQTQEGVLTAGKTAILSRAWTADESDVYTVKVFVWDGLGDVPTALAQVNTGMLNVQ